MKNGKCFIFRIKCCRFWHCKINNFDIYIYKMRMTVFSFKIWTELQNLHNAHGIGKTRTLLPASNYYDWITSLDKSTLFAKTHTKLYSIIYVFRPIILSWFCYEENTNSTIAITHMCFVFMWLNAFITIYQNTYHCSIAAKYHDINGIGGPFVGNAWQRLLDILVCISILNVPNDRLL